jgi:hypothetical protein
MGCYETKGSKLQVQLYVNRFQPDLNEALIGEPKLASLGAQGADSIRWVSPLERHGCEELQDADFLRAIGQDQLIDSLGEFWPSGGPVWDALAIVDLKDGGSGAVLVEGKSHTGEFFGRGSQAGMSRSGSETPPSEESKENRERIRRALAATQESLDLAPDPDRWMGRLYQTANRIAYQRWLAEQGVKTWLVWLLFTGDPIGAATKADWEQAVESANAELGLDGVDLHDLAHVCLEARDVP